MTVQLPSYDRQKLTPGIVHIGLGNFHRAHMAVYLDDLFAMGLGHDWAILGAGVREGDARMRDALKAQDCLSTVIELDPKGKSARRVGSMIDFLPVRGGQRGADCGDGAARDPDRQSDGDRGRLFHQPGDRGLRSGASRDCSDDGPNPHRTAFGAIIAALKARKAAGIAPFTVMSCDNLPGNGHVTEKAVVGLARLSRTPRWRTGSRRTWPSRTGWWTGSPPPLARASGRWPQAFGWATTRCR